MKLNTATATIATHEGATAYHLTPERRLRRLVMACLLWEDQFYIDGKSHADLIAATIPLCKPEGVAAMAVEARGAMKLRHVPLLLAREMARHKTHRAKVAAVLEAVIQRPDELAEFLMIYDPKYGRGTGKGQPLAAQVKKGLARAFQKFDAYALAKYDRVDAKVRLKDVLFFSHSKPKDGAKGLTRKWRKAVSAYEQDSRLSPGGKLYRDLIGGVLPTPDTWEVSLSIGKDKKESFERLIAEGKLGALALLRNLRNMSEAGVSREIISAALATMRTERVLPFRFISAARAVPQLEPLLEPAMYRCLVEQEKMPGRTVVVVDTSGSMDSAVSAKSEVMRVDAAAGLAILAREQFDEAGLSFIAFSDEAVPVPPRRGFALRDAIKHATCHGGTDTAKAIRLANSIIGGYDRLIVITDEQSHTAYPDPLPEARAYVINVGAYKNGLGYGRWVHIDGFSEATLRFISAHEKEGAA